MAFSFQGSYDEHIEQRMRGFYETLSEKDRRRYAALEAAKLGHGGIEDVSRVLGCSRQTIERSQEELEQLSEDPATDRVRREGAGRPKAIVGSTCSSKSFNVWSTKSELKSAWRIILGIARRTIPLNGVFSRI